MRATEVSNESASVCVFRSLKWNNRLSYFYLGRMLAINSGLPRMSDLML
jgi:hypothetical protein